MAYRFVERSMIVALLSVLGALPLFSEEAAVPHWAFVEPRSPALPEVMLAGWSRNEIDHYILANLEREGLAPSPEAGRETLIRRLTLDLTGLPPTLEQVDAFLGDKSPDAYEKVVDRLLASPRYGERMAVMWLDLARYGDTSVYHQDGAREMWAWRDGIIAAYNANKPFDRFTIDQLAGDLLPDATLEQRIASGFNRNNGTTDEGGLIEEEMRVEYAVDRVKTTATTWLGLTLECAQCHDHFYDPISQVDYYKFFAFFNVSADKGKQTSARNAPPLIEIPDEENERQLPAVVAQRAENQARIDGYPDEIAPELRTWVKELGARIADPKQNFDPRDALLHLTLDEAEGERVGNRARILPGTGANDGRVVGTPRWVPARTGGGFEFKEGEEAFLEVAHAGDFERDQPFTLSFWLKPVKTGEGKDSQGSLLARIEKGDSQRGVEVYYETNQRLYVRLAHEAESDAIRIRSDREIQWDKWQHICVTYDGSSTAGGIRLFVDGVAWAIKGEQDNLKGSIRTGEPLRIGTRPMGYRPLGTVDEIRIFSRALSEDEARALVLRDTVVPLLARVSGPTWRADQLEPVLAYYLEKVSKVYPQLLKRERDLKNQEEELRRPKTTVMVMEDRARATYVLRRGSYDNRTDIKVEPGLPESLPALPEDAPRNRLGLAQWLFQKENPLTARVAVNRYWQMLFGVGLVATPEDFGTQGELPSHPALLDWLAVDFRNHGWNVKRMLRSIVTSATYRQSAAASVELYQRDPANRLLARGSRYRLQAEFLRDNALSLSGLLVERMGGPGVKPYQPEGLWKDILQGGDRPFIQDKGKSLYRRSVYTFWRRTCAPPNMLLFDAPTREKCIAQRSRTNTPLQALVTLNDVQYVEAARHLAERMIAHAGSRVQDSISWGFRLATSRAIKERELVVLLGVYQDCEANYREDVEAAGKLLSTGASPRDEALDVAEHAALTIVASIILNLDETLSRE
ncbi:MAG: hypothetical protein CMP27_02480 [Roseibacillus sp.]|nr:hypothetical protein [Roseibacillus sp.]